MVISCTTYSALPWYILECFIASSVCKWWIQAFSRRPQHQLHITVIQVVPRTYDLSVFVMLIFYGLRKIAVSRQAFSNIADSAICWTHSSCIMIYCRRICNNRIVLQDVIFMVIFIRFNRIILFGCVAIIHNSWCAY